MASYITSNHPYEKNTMIMTEAIFNEVEAEVKMEEDFTKLCKIAHTMLAPDNTLIIQPQDEKSWEFISLLNLGHKANKISYSTVKCIIEGLAKNKSFKFNDKANDVIISCKDGSIKMNKLLLLYSNEINKNQFESKLKEIKNDKFTKYHLEDDTWSNFSINIVSNYKTYLMTGSWNIPQKLANLPEIGEYFKLGTFLQNTHLFSCIKKALNQIVKYGLEDTADFQHFYQEFFEIQKHSFFDEKEIKDFELNLLTNWLNKSKIDYDKDSDTIRLNLENFLLIENAPHPLNTLLIKYTNELSISRKEDLQRLPFYVEFYPKLLEKIEAISIRGFTIDQNIPEICSSLSRFKRISFKIAKSSSSYDSY